MAISSPLESEIAIRLAAMDWLASFGKDSTFRYEQLADLHFGDLRLPLTDRGRGIRKPALLEAAISFSTVYTSPGAVRPYADAEGPNGLLRYKMQGSDPNRADNVAMRKAMTSKLPLIWFVGVSSAVYLPTYPVYLVAEEPGQFVVALDQAQRHLAVLPGESVVEDDRRYAAGITQRRLHQPLFRARLLEAYSRRCSMCQLRHVSLLDASHILDNKHQVGQPVVLNGLALCKIHHAAFDQNILGVSPDYRIAVRGDILIEIDGPMLKHGLQALEGEKLNLPKSRAAAPDRERLEVRWGSFQEAS